MAFIDCYRYGLRKDGIVALTERNSTQFTEYYKWTKTGLVKQWEHDNAGALPTDWSDYYDYLGDYFALYDPAKSEVTLYDFADGSVHRRIDIPGSPKKINGCTSGGYFMYSVPDEDSEDRSKMFVVPGDGERYSLNKPPVPERKDEFIGNVSSCDWIESSFKTVSDYALFIDVYAKTTTILDLADKGREVGSIDRAVRYVRATDDGFLWVSCDNIVDFDTFDDGNCSKYDYSIGRFPGSYNSIVLYEPPLFFSDNYTLTRENGKLVCIQNTSGGKRDMGYSFTAPQASAFRLGNLLAIDECHGYNPWHGISTYHPQLFRIELPEEFISPSDYRKFWRE